LKIDLDSLLKIAILFATRYNQLDLIYHLGGIKYPKKVIILENGMG
jgi:hypothetical protein